MKFLFQLFLGVLIISLSASGYAQTAAFFSAPARSIDTAKVAHRRAMQRPAPPKITKIKPVRKELSGGLALNTNGWGAYIDLGKVKSNEGKQSDMFYNVRMWQLDFEEIKDPHEKKSNSTDVNGAGSYAGGKINPFIYGKINNFYALNLDYGYRKMIAGKPEPGTISIHWVGAVGLSVGLLKPYYLQAYYNGVQQNIKYSDQTKDAFLTPGDIVGAAGFSQGLGETKIIPGLHLRTGLHFDFATSRKTILAVETGMNAECYTQSIPLMALQKNVPYFFNLYAAFQFGKRW